MLLNQLGKILYQLFICQRPVVMNPSAVPLEIWYVIHKLAAPSN